MRARVRIRNVGEVARKIETLYRAAGEELVSGMRVVGEMVMTDVKAARPGAGVPVDTGALRASGRVSGPGGDGVVSLTFGNAAAPYALRQHEELRYRHTVGEARYLVRALERFEAGHGPEDALREVADAAIRRARAA
jgi:hypothetical protein